MDNLRNTRRNYIQAQNSDKIKRESKHYVRTNASEIYENGEKVYFRKITDVGKVGQDKAASLYQLDKVEVTLKCTRVTY